ncbi:MAG: DUF2207 domain-containing protein [Woeseiaceae bacterium]|nr:DUF2207 domain-containing protein [Woeseiaceae bacterium]
MRAIWTVALLASSAIAGASERILSFHSDIRVMDDGWIEVTETIRVNAEGDRIRRGIYRDQFTDYEDYLGNRYVAEILPMEVLRNDQRESFHTIDIDRGIRTYFGSRDRYITPGEHTYTYRYRANRLLGYFEEHDELYWQVTGFEWVFPIERATARVTLAFEDRPDDLDIEAYTGPYGARGSAYTSRLEAPGVAFFESTEPLSPVNGMTIVVGWPKGYVTEPTRAQRIGWVLRDNRNLIVALAGYLLLLAYYIPVWSRHGKDPEEGVIFTRYVPPKGFSPASLRYIRQMYYDNKVMTAAVVSLAVKGYLRIDYSHSKHSLIKLDPGPDAPELAAGERELYEGLFARSKVVALENENHERLGKAKAAHRKSLIKDYKHNYFQTNAWMNLPAILIVVLTAAAALIVGSGPTVLVIAAIVLSVATTIWFAILLKRPTLRGRNLLDEMLGFRDYLDVAEKDELNLRNPPDKTPELFERYLPFALALGVDQEWAEKFASVLASVRGPDGSGYSPVWYSGRWSNSSLSSTTKGLSSGLNSAIASSVTPPGSSSGGGGGGFSGGGGGGGGGGGW